MDDRLIELETRMAFQDRLIEQQGEALLEQSRRIDELEKRLERITEQKSSSESDSP